MKWFVRFVCYAAESFGAYFLFDFEYGIGWICAFSADISENEMDKIYRNFIRFWVG